MILNTILIFFANATKIISPYDFLVSSPDYGTSAITSSDSSDISFYTFSGAKTSDAYKSNIRKIIIENLDPMFISSTISKTDLFPSDRIYYGIFSLNYNIIIYGGLGSDDIKGDFWVYDPYADFWYDITDTMVYDDTEKRIPGRYDFAFCNLEINRFVIIGGIGAGNSALSECMMVALNEKGGSQENEEILVSDCFDYTICTGMSLSGAQAKYYNGTIYLFSGVNLEQKQPRYFNGLCKLHLKNGTRWEKVDLKQELIGSHRGGSSVHGTQLLYYFGSRFEGNKQVYNSDMFALNLSEPEAGWSRLDFNSSIGCDSFSSILHNNTVFVFGGLCSQDTQQTFTQLSLLNNQVETYSLITPTYSIGSSIFRSGADLYMFGGESDNLCHSNIWRYNTEVNPEGDNLNWVHLDKVTFSPSPRKNSASSSHGYFHLIAGGVDSTGKFLNDFWIFNTNSHTWFELLPRPTSSRPANFAHSCSILRIPYFYLLGGLSANREVIKEIWRYDFTQNTFTKLSPSSNIQFPGKYEFSCSYQKWKNSANETKESIFTFFGKNDAMGRSDCTIGRIDLLKNEYFYTDLKRSGRMQCVTSVAFHYENNKLLVVGGKGLSGIASKDIWVLSLNETHVSKEEDSGVELESPVYGSSFKSVDRKLYLFSGLSANGNSNSIGASDLVYKIDVQRFIHTNYCDIGYEIKDGVCKKCPKGTFSRAIEKNCEKCEPDGTLTEHEGATSGVECLVNLKYLPSEYIDDIEKAIGFKFTEEDQAPLYQPPNLIFFYVPFGIVMLVFISIFLSIFFAVKNFAMFIIENSLMSDLKIAKSKPLPKVKDLEQPLLSDEKYKKKVIQRIAKERIKKEKKEKEMKLMKKIKKKSEKSYSVKEFIGGVLTGLLVLTLIAILIYLPVDYINNNKKEKNELIPTVTFLNQFKDLNNTMTINIVTYPFNYGDCSVNLTYSDLLQVTYSNKIIFHTISENVSVSFACHIHLIVKKSALFKQDLISLNFLKKSNYAKNIFVWAEAESAKRGYKSRFFQEVNSSNGYSFDGREPTVFKFLTVPAYFQDEMYFSSKVNNSGLIIHSNETPKLGSEIEDSHLKLGSSLSLKIALVASESSMLTTFYLQIGLVKFLSILSAQVMGIFGVFEAGYIGFLYLMLIFKRKEERLQENEDEEQGNEDEEEKKTR